MSSYFAPLNPYRRRRESLGTATFEEAIRAEIFGLARFESHAESLARAQTVLPHPDLRNGLTYGSRGNLARRLHDNGLALEAAYLEILEGVEEKRAITPAAEWLIDNFHIVRALLRDVHDNLPPKYYAQLPKLAEGHLKTFPRVYGIAWAYVAHTDSRLDPETLVSFVKAYQRVQPLTIGELWAVSISLRMVLIENLRRIGVRIAGSQRARKEADSIANEILGLKETNARPIEKVIAALEAEPLSGAFTVQLLQRLRFQGSRFDPLLEWLEKRLVREGQNPDELVAGEHLSQTAANATVKNIITSARLMSTFDWQGFFEQVSLVEQTLRTHPTYPDMDFPTRNRYQQAIEELARHSPMSELEVAELVVSKCASTKNDERAQDPGFYLISVGRFLLEPECKFRAPASLRLRRWYMRRATPLYLGAIFTATAAIWLPVSLLYGGGTRSLAAIALSVVGLLPVSQIALGIVNRLTIALLGPRHIPRRRLDGGIPQHLRTFVVVPTMFLDENRIDEQLEQLEIYYLANPRGDLYFALLSDWRDADQENLPSDDHLLEIARRRLAKLNEKHGASPEGYDRFHVFHRRRLFNGSEGKWIGWERKRGKLHEFNRLLRGATDTSFLPVDGKPAAAPPGVRYVITLDADTRLPNGAAAQLVGAMAHPLNKARYDAKTGRVVSGYGILQPRVTPTLPTTKEATIFQRLSTGPSGIDPYASAISDVYQDLFGEGSFTGKGIYDVDAFETALEGRIPENSLLSHDLFEGNFARCGFVSDVEVFEDFPWHSGVAAARNHRWIRGDWQLLPWILGRSGSALSMIGRWKMIDNLRRSLVPPCAFLTLALAFSLPRAYASLWAAVAVLSLAADPLISAIAGLLPARNDASFAQHLANIGESFLSAFEQLALAFALAPHHAFVNADATFRALWRLCVSRKHLLEWTTAAQTARSASLRLRDFVRDMRGAVLLTFVAFVALALIPATNWRLALPTFLIWYFSPLIAKFVSTPHRRNYARPLRIEDVKLLNMTGRRIWRFFATFVTAHDNHLPPDNFQETPQPVIAHRSSPTNFGLYLLSTLAARDFGWIGVEEAAERLERTLVSMRDLPRFEGHFYNWYETTDRRALDPRYISSVDNGNLAGHLLAVAQGCQELLEHFTPNWGFNQGLVTTFLLLQEASNFLLKRTGAISDAEGELLASLEVLTDAFLLPDPLEAGGIEYWDGLALAAERLHAAAGDCRESAEDARYAELEEWSAAILSDIRSHSRDLHTLVPWSVYRKVALSAQYAPLAKTWEGLRARLAAPAPLKGAVAHAELMLEDIAEMGRLCGARNLAPPAFLAPLKEAVEDSIRGARALSDRLSAVSRLCNQLFQDMNFGLLYDPVRKLFSIGYRVAEGELDASFYDLMASEARLTSFVAIAKGDVPVSHWFRLGRSLTKVDHGAALLSWSGSMFEYLMPSLVMHTPEGSLMDQTTRFAVRRQVQYGAERGVPWGVSESAYNKRDLHLTYQYSNFGVPDLGLKRGLGGDLVIAPYATLLAAMIDPVAATENLRKLERHGGLGPFGYYEAIDFTPSRLPEGKKFSVVKCYMAHHQGMSLVSIANVLLGQNMRARFHADPVVQAAGLLLQERTPKNVSIGKPREESFHVGFVREETDHAVRTYHNVNRPVPTTQVLSNGEYTVMLTSSGSGFSRCRELAVTRWREDVTLDNYGTYFYLRDLESGARWSAGYQPTAATPDRYEVTFAEDRARFLREDNGIVSELEVFVSPEENAELRRLTLTNPGPETREIEITSYCEVVLAPPLADAAHPAFSNLFVQTEFLPDLETLVATRRVRSAKEIPAWMAHSIVTDRHAFGPTQWESDRVRFLGRNRTVRDPAALEGDHELSNTTGPVLDPVFSLRKKVRLIPGVPCHVTFATMVARNREELIHFAEKFRAPSTYERVSDLAWTQAQVKLHYLGIEPDEASLFQRLGTRMLFADPSLRPSGEIIKRCAKDVTGLWAQGISGDNPIMLLRVDDIEDRGIVRQLLKAQEYFGTKGLTVDLVILNDKASSYTQEVQTQLEAMARSGMVASHSAISQSKGSAFVLRADLLSHEDRILLYASARAVLSSRQGSLAEQVRRVKATPPGVTPPRARNPWPALPHEPEEVENLRFFQGLGGFTPDGREYVISLKPGQHTPAPWINVISNPGFGFQVSESGAGYTWSANSRENQLTPWLNDPVSDPSGEAIYLYDQDAGVLWSPTASPVRQKSGTYVIRHGQGYSRFEHVSHGIRSELTQYVALDAPVKISRLTLENRSRSTRRIAVTGYVEWVLGFSRSVNAPGTVTELDEASGALFAINPRSNEFGARCAFFAVNRKVSSLTCDRTEFLGRNGSHGAPESLLRPRLSNRVGAALDPCSALQCELEIPPGKTVEITFYLGQSESRSAARELMLRLRDRSLDEILQDVITHWDQKLGAVHVKTPDEATNLLLNRWLLYQTTVCRFWARAAFYQAGGAFGFRDQLQDSLALLYSQPATVREHILRASARQFIEGDVQHWWHPPSGRGVRTHFSDDLLWLPFAAHQYLRVTGDSSLLDMETTFLEGPLLRPEQEDSYYTPTVSHSGATLFEHCARALERSLAVGFGAHGLPLMGAGDWNDGMNRVGHDGKGESVWLAWFLAHNLRQFAVIARERGQADRAGRWEEQSQRLVQAVETTSWDGEWYRRAYFDDGTPLGSKANDECRIDSLTQTWAVISGLGDPARARASMEAVGEWLVKERDKMILLFTPPFDKTPQDPGYIRGYLPGVRENGGQYTHAAIWCVVAEAMLGNGRRAFDLFSLLNPINHSLEPESMELYKVEPYVLAADVYSEPPHRGRGGWTWYTGSCGWMYRAGMEYILGLEVRGNELRLSPCIPPEWPEFQLRYRFGRSEYAITVRNPNGISRGKVEFTPGSYAINLHDDGVARIVEGVLR